MKRASRSNLVSSSTESNLPLFPSKRPTPSAPSQRSTRHAPHSSDPSQASAISLAQVMAEWGPLVRRLGRRHPVLEAILTAGSPLRVLDRTVVVGFSPHRLFHKELLDLPKYRTLTELELSRWFGVVLLVTTVLSPEPGRPRHWRGVGPAPA